MFGSIQSSIAISIPLFRAPAVAVRHRSGMAMSALAITPMLALKNNIEWKNVEIIEDLVGISGGFLKKPLSAPSLLIMAGKTPHRFVEVNKNSEWFLKAVGGPGTQKGELKAVHVLDDIRNVCDAMDKTAVADDIDTSAVAGEADEVELDPMDALDDVMETPCKTKPKAKAKPKQNVIPSSVIDVTMPRRPKCAGGSTESVTVTLYVKSRIKHENVRTSKLYVSTTCINWLLAYAADEKFFEGVARAEGDEAKEPNCAAVAGLNLEWNFGTRSWKAEFVTGDFAGTNRELAITDLSTSQWEKIVQNGMPGAEGEFKDVPYLKKKQVCKAFMSLWCEAIARKQGKEFEEFWGLEVSRKAVNRGKRPRAS